MNNKNSIPNPFYTLFDSAVTFHETFMAFISAGFTREEAMELLKHLITEFNPLKEGE